MIWEQGDKFNHWTYIEPSKQGRTGYAVFKCYCGTVKEVNIITVIKGKSKSCKCCKGKKLGLEKNEYKQLKQAFYRAKNRCYNPKNSSYGTHGGRGIQVCDEWLNDPESFVRWALDNGWRPHLTLDRIDNDGDYTPSNCRWTDWKTQGRNRRTCIYFEHGGETKCMMEWCETFGIPHYLACNRYKRGYKDFDTVFYQGDLKGREEL